MREAIFTEEVVGGKLVDIGRSIPGIAVTAEMVGSECIDDDEDNVRALWRLGPGTAG